MKTLLSLAAGLLLAGSFALGGGYDCSNTCPLAQTANTHRSTGNEATVTKESSEAAREVVVTRVRSNLDRI